MPAQTDAAVCLQQPTPLVAAHAHLQHAAVAAADEEPLLCCSNLALIAARHALGSASVVRTTFSSMSAASPLSLLLLLLPPPPPPPDCRKVAKVPGQPAKAADLVVAGLCRLPEVEDGLFTRELGGVRRGCIILQKTTEYKVWREGRGGHWVAGPATQASREQVSGQLWWRSAAAPPVPALRLPPGPHAPAVAPTAAQGQPTRFLGCPPANQCPAQTACPAAGNNRREGRGGRACSIS